MRKLYLPVLFLGFIALPMASCQPALEQAEVQAEPTPTYLPTQNEGNSWTVIMDFVKKTTDPGSADFIPEKDRIAVFDNDGTLWTELPYYFHLDYALFFIRKDAPNHPEWSKNPVLKAVIDNDLKGVIAGGEKGLIELVMLSHAGMTEDQFNAAVSEWLATAEHLDSGKPLNKMTFTPMVELLDYLRAYGYKTFIFSGGGIGFIRVWGDDAYGIPPYQVVGSSIKAKYEEVNGVKSIVKLLEINFFDDKEEIPVGIHQNIGMKPINAVGNSDGDYAMLEYTTQAKGPRLGILIHHTDLVREYAYDNLSTFGNLKKGLIDGPKLGWLIVDMEKEWSKIHPD